MNSFSATYHDPTRPRRWRWIVGILALVLPGLWFAFRVSDLPAAQLRAKYTSPDSVFVTVESGLSIHVRDEGQKDALPVVLLHGSNSSLQTWEPWATRLKSRYRVVTMSLPGHGLTGPHPRRDYSPAAFDAVVLKVADMRGLGRFVIGGNSMGGEIAARFAANHPERVAGLLLVDASGAPFKGEADLPIGFRIARTPVIRDIVEQITPRSLIAKSLEGTVADPRVLTPALVDRYWELLLYPGNREATIDRFSTPYHTLDAIALARLKVPVAIVWGREDRLIPVDSASWFKRALPQSTVTILDHVGHVPMEEAPDRSLAPVLPFLAGIAAQTGEAPRSPAR